MANNPQTTPDELSQLISAACAGLVPESEIRAKILAEMHRIYQEGYDSGTKKCPLCGYNPKTGNSE